MRKSAVKTVVLPLFCHLANRGWRIGYRKQAEYEIAHRISNSKTRIDITFISCKYADTLEWFKHGRQQRNCSALTGLNGSLREFEDDGDGDYAVSAGGVSFSLHKNTMKYGWGLLQWRHKLQGTVNGRLLFIILNRRIRKRHQNILIFMKNIIVSICMTVFKEHL